MTVHVALPSALANAAAAVLDDAGVPYVSHDDGDPVAAAAAAADDPRAVALLGPFYSADVAEALEVTAPAGLPLLAPIATWAGVTRDDEPGCDDAARHRGTVLRMVARDTEVAARLASHLRASGRRASSSPAATTTGASSTVSCGLPGCLAWTPQPTPI